MARMAGALMSNKNAPFIEASTDVLQISFMMVFLISQMKRIL